MEKSWQYVTISVAAFICYCNSLWGTFVFDDSEAIVKNKDVMPYIPISEIFRNDFWGANISSNSSHKSYRPLTILSYRLNVLYSNNKLDAFQFHATNVILYGLLCILTIPIFELFIRKRKNERNVNELAYMASLLFTVHPIHTECVAGLVGRADILCSILFLLIILLYHHVITSKSFISLLLTVILTAAAILCKETAITVLGMCMVYDLFYKKKKSKSWWDVLQNHGFIFRFIFLTIAGCVMIFFRFKIMNFEGPIFTSFDNPAAFDDSFITRTFSYNYVYLLNIVLLIWPEWLCFDWSMGCIPLIEGYTDFRSYLVLLFWIILVAMTYTVMGSVRKHEILDARVMSLSLITLPFLPASNLLIKVGFVIAERTLLLPSAGFALLISIGLKKLENKFPLKQKPLQFCFYIVCIIFTLCTIQRNNQWLNEERLFTSALSVCPRNAKVHYNIAKIAGDKRDFDMALKEYKMALELNPRYEQAMNNLANLYREQKQFKEAEILLRKAVNVRPNFAAAWMNLGIVLTNLNQTEEAEFCYKTAISHRKKYPDCYYNLGNLFLDLKRHKEALEAWEMAVLYKPRHLAAWSNTLVLLDSMKEYDRVLELGRTALLHNPRSPALHFSLANTLGKLQEFKRAEGHFLEAIGLSGNSALYYSNLGVLYHRWGKVEKAKEMYRKALEIEPEMRITQLNLERLVKNSGS